MSETEIKWQMAYDIGGQYQKIFNTELTEEQARAMILECKDYMLTAENNLAGEYIHLSLDYTDLSGKTYFTHKSVIDDV